MSDDQGSETRGAGGSPSTPPTDAEAQAADARGALQQATPQQATPQQATPQQATPQQAQQSKAKMSDVPRGYGTSPTTAPGDQRFFVRVVLRERNAGAIYDAAKEVSTPNHLQYGHFLSHERIWAFGNPEPRRVRAIVELFKSAGLEVFELENSPLVIAAGNRLTLATFFEPDALERVVQKASRGTMISPWEWSEQRLRDQETSIKSIHVTAVGGGDERRDRPTPMGGWFFPHVKRSRRASGSLPYRQPVGFKPDDDSEPPSLENGATPALIRSIYGFPSDLTGDGETIAIMTLGSGPRDEDLLAFWASAGIQRELPERVRIGPPADPNDDSSLYRLEATMGPAWAGAMAPKAKLILYEICLELPDPWLYAVEAAVADEKRRPSVLCMTWTSPEEFYYRQFNRSSISLALAKAAALGITVVCASGDWGAYDGRPSAVIRIGKNQFAKIARAPWPHATFPSTEEYVLSVGGTMVSALRPLTEVAWSGPLPPDPDLLQELPFLTLATSGGFSQRVPIPSFQRNAVLGSGFSRVYSRGSNNPGVLPFGRGYPDVALMAAGRSVMRAYPRGLSATGYRLVVEDQWIDYAGGTSLAAPIWACVIALLNEARRRHSRERVGFFNPLLYYLARTRPLSGPNAVIRQIDDGHSDIEFRVMNGEGQVNRHVLPGYQAGAGWDPATGLGVPHVQGLVRALETYPSSEPWIAAFDVASEVVHSE